MPKPNQVHIVFTSMKRTVTNGLFVDDMQESGAGFKKSKKKATANKKKR